LASALLALCSLLVVVFHKDTRWAKGRGQVLLILLFLVYLISSFVNGLSIIEMSQGVYQRNFGLFFWLALLILYGFASSGKEKVSSFLERGLPIVLVTGLIYGLAQRFDKDPFPWVNPYDAIQLTLGNPNFAGALFGMLAVLPIAFLLKNRNLLILFAGILIFGLTIFVALGTKSLQAIVVMALGEIIFALVLLVKIKKFAARAFRYISVLGGMIVLALTPLILFTKVGFLDGVREKFFFQGSVAQRLDYWRTGIEIFKDNLWFGVGPDQFQRYAALYRTKEQVVRDGSFVIPDKAHSVLIDALANGGIFAGILWATFVGFIFVKLIQTARMELSSGVRLQLAVLGAIWSGYVFQALISPDQLVLAVIGFISAGFIVYINRSQVKAVEKNLKFEFLFDDPWYLRTVFIAVLIFASVVWGQAISADMAAKKVLNNENLNKESVLVAVNKWPAPKTTELIAVAVSQKDSQCDVADELADRLIELDDRSAQGWYLKAICFNVNRELDKALSASENALKFDPLNPTYLVAKAKLGIASGQKDSALAALAVIKENYPDNPEITPLETSISVMS
jgi:O-antigen ligase